MANNFATPTWTLKELGRRYQNSLRFVANVDRQYSGQFVQAGAHVGNTINYRLPPRFTVSDGQALDVQNLNDRTVPIALTNQKHVDMAWSTWQETTEIDDVNDRYIQQASDALASVVDALAFRSVYRDVFAYIGALGTPPSTNLAYLQAGRFLTDQAGPRPGRVAVLDPDQTISISNVGYTNFNPQGAISANYRDGMIGNNQLGITEWYEDQNVALFTSGSATGASTPIVNGASQTGSSLITSGWSTFSGKRGDIITLAGVYTVNPLSYESTNRLQRFTLTADVTDSAGAATLTISPSIVTSGPLQTVNVSPANSAVITYWAMAAGGTLSATASRTGMVYLPYAFGFVTEDLARPSGGANSERISSKLRGLSLRMIEVYDPQTDQNITRLDTIIGAATLRPEWACRVQG
jgi:hypothetical protein